MKKRIVLQSFLLLCVLNYSAYAAAAAAATDVNTAGDPNTPAKNLTPSAPREIPPEDMEVLIKLARAAEYAVPGRLPEAEDRGNGVRIVERLVQGIFGFPFRSAL